MLLNHYMLKDLLNGVSPMSKKSFTKKKLGIEPWDWNVATAPLNWNVGKKSSLKNSSPAKVKTPSGSGIPISQKSGVTLSIQYKGCIEDSPVNKIIKLTREQAYGFIKELNNEVPFPTIKTENQTISIPAKNITEIRIEEDECSVSKSKRKKITDMGSGKTSKPS